MNVMQAATKPTNSKPAMPRPNRSAPPLASCLISEPARPAHCVRQHRHWTGDNRKSSGKDSHHPPDERADSSRSANLPLAAALAPQDGQRMLRGDCAIRTPDYRGQLYFGGHVLLLGWMFSRDTKRSKVCDGARRGYAEVVRARRSPPKQALADTDGISAQRRRLSDAEVVYECSAGRVQVFEQVPAAALTIRAWARSTPLSPNSEIKPRPARCDFRLAQDHFPTGASAGLNASHASLRMT